MGILLGCLGTQSACCAANCACCLGKYAIGCITSSLRSSVATRLFYTIGFIISSVLAYCLYNFGYKIPNVLTNECGRDCWSYLAVMRISFALVLYHSFFSLFTFAIRNTRDWRAWLHNGLWSIKAILYVGLNVAVFYIPNTVFYTYHIPALIFAGMFILIQSFLLVDFAWSWAQRWIEAYEESLDGDEWYKNMLIFFCFLFYSVTIGISIWLLIDFGVPKRDGCGLNTYFVVMNLILVITQSAISVLPQIQEATPRSGLFQSSFLSVYTTYLTASAILSEPNDDGFRCNVNRFNDDSDALNTPLQNIMTYVGLGLAFIALGYSAFSSGSSALFMEPVPGDEAGNITENNAGESNDDEVERTVYDYSYFHFCLVLAAFYMSMVISDWSTAEGTAPSSVEKIKIVRGFGAMWAKIAMSWVCVALYIWTLVAPLIFPERDFSV